MKTVSVSAANLITKIENMENGNSQTIVVRHPIDIGLHQSLSAGPAIHYIATNDLSVLGVNVGALKEKTGSAYFARYYDGRIEGLPVEKYPNFMRQLVHGASGEESLFDWRVLPELTERLTQPYWNDIHPPLLSREMSTIKVEAHDLVRQPSAASGQGGQGHKVRIFRPCTLHMPGAVFQKILDCSAFQPLYSKELQSTNGGKSEGYFIRSGVRCRLANNVGVKTDPKGLFQL